MVKVLLVEDEKGLARAMQEALIRSGFDVRYAANRLAAVELCKQRQPDLIILDWMISALDGSESLRRFRRVSMAPMLLLISHLEEEHRARKIEIDADDTLLKPFDMDELVRRAQNLRGSGRLPVEEEAGG